MENQLEKIKYQKLEQIKDGIDDLCGTELNDDSKHLLYHLNRIIKKLVHKEYDGIEVYPKVIEYHLNDLLESEKKDDGKNGSYLIFS